MTSKKIKIAIVITVLELSIMKKSYYWNTILYGFDKAKTYNTYVHINDTDTITMKFTTSSNRCDGSKYCSDTNEIYYNGTKVYSDGTISKKLNPKYGKTEIKIN